MLSARFLRQSLVTASVITITANMLSRVFGYFREASIANYFGTSSIFDTFILAFTIPELVAAIIFTAMPVALLPALKKMPQCSSDDDSKAFWSGLITLSLLFAVISILIFAFRGEILRWLAPQLSPEHFPKGARFLAILSLFVMFRGMEAYFRSWLFAKKHFIIPAFSGIALNIVILASLFLFYDKFDIETLAYGWLGASIILFTLNGIAAFYVVRPGCWPMINNPWLKILFQSLFAIAALESISLIYPLIDRYLAAKWLGPGQIAALRYASILIQIPTGIFVVAFNVASFPWITDYSIPGKIDNLRKLYKESFNLLFFSLGFTSLAILIFSTEVVSVAFLRGAFDKTSLELTGAPLMFYAMGAVFHSIYIFQMRFFYARSAFKRLGAILLIKLFIKLVLSILLVGPMEHGGLALATAISWLCAFLIMTFDLHRNLNISTGKLISSSPLRTVILLGVVATFWLILKEIWPVDGISNLYMLLFQLGLVVFSGAILYFGLGLLLRMPEPKRILNILLFRSSRRMQ